MNTKYTNSPLVDIVRISNNKTTNRTHSIDTITIHCYVGQVSAQRGLDYFATTNKDCSCNYIVGCDGKVGLCVEEKDRSWCTSNSKNDHRAITIEVACDTKYPYTVNTKAYDKLIELVTDICKRNGIKKLVWSNNKSFRVNHLNGCNMTVHRDYANKSCPGEWLYSRHEEIASKVNKMLNTETNKSFKIKIHSDIDLNIRSGPSTSYNIVGVIKDHGVYTIVDVDNGHWGLLKSYSGKRNGWISIHKNYVDYL